MGERVPKISSPEIESEIHVKTIHFHDIGFKMLILQGVFLKLKFHAWTLRVFFSMIFAKG